MRSIVRRSSPRPGRAPGPSIVRHHGCGATGRALVQARHVPAGRYRRGMIGLPGQRQAVLACRSKLAAGVPRVRPRSVSVDTPYPGRSRRRHDSQVQNGAGSGCDITMGTGTVLSVEGSVMGASLSAGSDGCLVGGTRPSRLGNHRRRAGRQAGRQLRRRRSGEAGRRAMISRSGRAAAASTRETLWPLLISGSAVVLNGSLAGRRAVVGLAPPTWCRRMVRRRVAGADVVTGEVAATTGLGVSAGR